jgi:hypothetical protein
LSDSEPVIVLRPGSRQKSGRNSTVASGHSSGHSSGQGDRPAQGEASGRRVITNFNKQELGAILAVYGRKVAAGEWRDYAIDMGREKAVFSIFRRSSECALVRIEKDPKLARKQGAYCVIAASGQILKRGHDLVRVLGVLEKSLRLVR